MKTITTIVLALLSLALAVKGLGFRTYDVDQHCFTFNGDHG